MSLFPPLVSGTLHVFLYCSDLLPHAAGNEPNSPAFTLRAASLPLRFPRGLVGTLSQYSFTSSMIGGTSLLPPWPTALWYLLFSLAFPPQSGVEGCRQPWRVPLSHGADWSPCSLFSHALPRWCFPSLLVLVEGHDLHSQLVSTCPPRVEVLVVL